MTYLTGLNEKREVEKIGKRLLSAVLPHILGSGEKNSDPLSTVLIVTFTPWQRSGHVNSLRGLTGKLCTFSCHLLTAWIASFGPISLSDGMKFAQASDDEFGFAFLGLSGGGNR